MPVLDRRLGPLDAAVIVVSNVIGIGIFTTPGIVASMLPGAGAIIAVWAAGGALALAGALAYAELATRRPQAGGEYVYLREAFGGLAAFLTGWTSFVAGFAGAIAAGAVGVTAYLDRFLPGAGSARALAAWHAGPLTVTVSPRSIVAMALIVGLALVHARGVGPGRWMQNALTLAKVAALTLFVVAGFLVARPAAAQPAAAAVAPAAWLLALVPVMFSYSGWNAAVYVAEEIRDPDRHVPAALAAGTATVAALYLALNALYLRVLPHDAIAGAINVGALAADRLFGSAAGALFAALAIVIVLGSLSAMTLAGPRVYFAMARDAAFFRSAAIVHPKYRTPAVAILAQAAWSCVLVLTGTFDGLLTYTGFAVVLFSTLAVLSLFVVRRRDERAAPFRAWGYPWAPAIFCVAGFAIVVNAVAAAPAVALAGLAVMAAGVPVFAWTRRQSRSAAH